MKAIRTKLVSIGVENYESKYYILFAQLEQFLDAENARRAIIGSGLEPPVREEVIQTVLGGGKRVFAILVQIDSMTIYRLNLSTPSSLSMSRSL
jgi:hypothetical protein